MISPLWKNLTSSPWGIATLLQLPYASLYLYYLWAHTHYQFYPILIAVLVYLAYSRWSDRTPLHRNILIETSLGISGVALAIAATMLVSAWLSYLAFVLILAAWLSNFADRDTGKPLTYLAWPLLIAWQPPYSDLDTADTHLITYLQQLSSHMSSRLLDVIGVPHFYFGSVIELADRSFSVEQGCSGVQSFFAILCISALMMVAFRRPVLHTMIVMLSSVVWTLLTNTLRITLIPLAGMALSVDLSHGTPHQIIGFAAMGIATWMLLSTDQLLQTLWSGSSAVRSANHESPLVFDQSPPNATATVRPSWSILTWSMLSVLGLLVVVQIIDIQKKTFRLVGGNVFLELQADDLPSQLLDWKNIEYQLETRTTDADFGERSDIWRFQSEEEVAVFSVDQTFRLWHDLTVCYRNAGWQIEGQKVVFGDDKAWPTVFSSFSRKDGRRALLAFCLFDRSSLPLEVPGYLDLWSSIRKRIEKRFSFSAGELFREQTCYQVQVFLETDSSNLEVLGQRVVKLLEAGRERVREIGLRRLNP
jgi:exosortase